MLNNQLENIQNESLIKLTQENNKAIVNLEKTALNIDEKQFVNDSKSFYIAPNTYELKLNQVVIIPSCLCNFQLNDSVKTESSIRFEINGERLILRIRLVFNLKTSLPTNNKFIQIISNEYLRTNKGSYTAVNARDQSTIYKINTNGFFIKPAVTIPNNTTITVFLNFYLSPDEKIFVNNAPANYSSFEHNLGVKYFIIPYASFKIPFLQVNGHSDVNDLLSDLTEPSTVYFNLNAFNQKPLNVSDGFTQLLSPDTLFCMGKESEGKILDNSKNKIGDVKVNTRGLFIKPLNDIPALTHLNISIDFNIDYSYLFVRNTLYSGYNQ